ncbi:MAG: putative alpha/beta superfamily hydrolase [Saprospiraceae bacterium]|jgi:predicted alpha/beta superfamily hydrolase
MNLGGFWSLIFDKFMMSKNNIYKLTCLILLLALQLDGAGQLTVIVDKYPEPLHVNENIFISGSFEGWSGGSADYQLSKEENYHVITLPKQKGTILFKFTKGSWESVETGANNKDIENRTHTSDLKADTIYATIENWNNQKEYQSTAAKNVHVMVEKFYMPLLDRHRGVRIYLPLGYESCTERYPVIYMHDGQNLFDKSTAYLDEWEVDETLNRLSAEHGFNTIVIGIDNGEDTRMDEYNPWIHPKYGGGEGDKYLRFIIDNLKPHIDSTLRTLPDRQNTSMIGSSMGGLISYYAGLKYPEVFGKVGVFSPSFWITDDLEKFTLANSNLEKSRMYFLAGAQESESMDADMLKIVNQLTELNPQAHDHLKSTIIEGGKHNEALWRKELATAILWLFEG